MASYSKQMMVVAKQWQDANKDQEHDVIRIPGRFQRPALLDDAERAMARCDEALELLNKSGRDNPELRAANTQLRELATQRIQSGIEVADLEDKLEALINQGLAPRHAKYVPSQELNPMLGRWCLAWGRNGYNVFDLSQDFTAAMLLTDCREIDIADVRLPFPGLLVIIPDGFARGADGTCYTKIHLTEVPRQVMNMLEVTGEIEMTLKSLGREGAKRVIDKIDREIAEAGGSLMPKSLLGPPVVLESRIDSALHIYATDGVRVLDTFVNRDGLTWDALESLEDYVEDDTDKMARHTLQRIVFGALAYLGAVESAAEPRQPAQRKKGQAREDGPRIWDVGRTIKIEPALVRAARLGVHEVAFRLKHRHIVRGHYRNQAHGIRRSERKRIWVAPFWRGPEDGAALVHTYKLEADKQ